jgi:hypothetical protein
MQRQRIFITHEGWVTVRRFLVRTFQAPENSQGSKVER